MNTEEAIKILSNYGVFGCGYCHQGGNEVEESFDMAIKALENSRWIPCSDRLPRIGEDVLVTFYHEYYVGCRAIVNKGITITHRNGNKSFSQFLDDEVLAWQPLPKPYEGNHGFTSKEEADLWMDGKPVGKEEI